MSCFPGSSNPSDPNSRTVNANDPRVTYTGVWTTQYDLQQHSYQVSNVLPGLGDKATATFVFTGTSVQVFGRDDLGINALFALDQDGSQGGGTTCQRASSQDTLLYDSPTTPQGQHTLFITNQGGPLSLSIFEVLGGSGTSSTSTSQHIAPQAPTSDRPPVLSQPSSSRSSALPISSSTSSGAGPSPPIVQSSSFLKLPPPNPSATASEISLSRTASDSAATSSPDDGGAPSYTTSSYTEVTVVGGSTTTIVIQTTVEVRQTQAYRGPSRGAVAGAAVGSLLFLFLLIGLGLWWWRRRRNRVRFLYGISNLDFGTFPAYSTSTTSPLKTTQRTTDPAMMTRSESAGELPSQGSAVRDSNATLYGDTLPPYKWPVSYSSLASEMKKHPPSECATSGVAGDGRPSTPDEPNTRRPSEDSRSLFDSHCSVRRIGLESAESAVPPSEEHHEVL